MDQAEKLKFKRCCDGKPTVTTVPRTGVVMTRVKCCICLTEIVAHPEVPAYTLSSAWNAIATGDK